MSTGNPLTLAESLTPEALILRLRSTEHDFVERKPRSQKGDWLQTAVAFANSTPIGWPAVLFVGVDNDGNPQQGPEKLEDLAKSVSDMLEQAYPAIYRHIVPLHIGDRACLAVVIPGSASRPHFAGKSYVRVGPQTVSASDVQFHLLIAERSRKVYEMRKNLGKSVKVVHGHIPGLGAQLGEYEGVIEDCSEFYVTVSKGGVRQTWQSYPLERVHLSFDYERDRLRFEIGF